MFLISEVSLYSKSRTNTALGPYGSFTQERRTFLARGDVCP